MKPSFSIMISSSTTSVTVFYIPLDLGEEDKNSNYEKHSIA